MNEAQVNGTQAGEAQVNRTQADEAVVDGAQEDEAVADDTLDDDTQVGGDGSDGPDMEKLRRLRLSGFLRELVRAEGRMEAAELLGVAYRTVVRAEESGQITGRVGDALERLLGTGDDPEVERLRERVGALEGGVEALAKEMRGGLAEIRAAVVGKDEAQGQGAGQPQAQDGEGAGRSETRAAPPVAGLRPEKRVRLPRLDPEVVTEGPADDDAEVYAGRARGGVVADDGGAAADSGAGDAGGARADAAPGDPGAQGLRAQGTDQPPLEGAGRHSGGVAEAEAAALGAPGPHRGAVAEVGRCWAMLAA